jgi:hypothetical protein
VARPARGARSRIVAAYVLLLLLSVTVALVVIDRVLTAQTDDRVASALDQEAAEFTRLAERGNDPATGRPFGDVRALFDTYLGRNVPGEGETLATYVDGRLYRTISNVRRGRTQLRPSRDRFARLTRREDGELETARGTAR